MAGPTIIKTPTSSWTRVGYYDLTTLSNATYSGSLLGTTVVNNGIPLFFRRFNTGAEFRAVNGSGLQYFNAGDGGFSFIQIGDTIDMSQDGVLWQLRMTFSGTYNPGVRYGLGAWSKSLETDTYLITGRDRTQVETQITDNGDFGITIGKPESNFVSHIALLATSTPAIIARYARESHGLVGIQDITNLPFNLFGSSSGSVFDKLTSDMGPGVFFQYNTSPETYCTALEVLKIAI